MRNELGEILKDELSKLITNDYIFLDLPYYTNIGDTLIWKGTEEFLNTVPYRCVYKAAIETYVTPKIGKDIIILLQGGGNFGDIWRRHTDFCLQILKEFPDNKVVVLPQTVYYQDKTIMKNDARQMAKHKSFTICARDTVTHALLENHFSKNNIVLLPDMAFFIPKTFLNKYPQPEQNKQLFFKRRDKELCDFDFTTYLKHQNVVEHEWPSMEYSFISAKILNALKRIHSLSKKKNLCEKLTGKIVDLYAVHFYMPNLLKIGIKFINEYNYIYSTRLHGAILGILLDKKITFFDNSYGKNSSFYNSWLKNNSDITFIKSR